MSVMRQFELKRTDSDTILMTWMSSEDTKMVRVGTIISMPGLTGRWECLWRGEVELEASQIQKKRFTNSAVRDRDGRWVV